jgi:hypothetical protein
MDTWSAAEVARQFGTSIPRVQRAVDRLELSERRGKGGRLKLSQQDVAQLRTELGLTPKIPGLTITEAKTLAALAISPLGVASVRVLARRANISPTSAGRALQHLSAMGLTLREKHIVALGRAKEIEVIRANVRAKNWYKISSQLAPIKKELDNYQCNTNRTPIKKNTLENERVPRNLRHLFWNTAKTQLSIKENGNYIATRLIQTMSLEGLAWGACHLSSANWRHAAKARGLPPEVRALALNLAKSREQ